MNRTLTHLAALASSAVPGLDPIAVQAARTEPGHYYEVAFVTDTEKRVWVIRVPVTAAAGAQMDTTVGLLGLIGRRLPFSVPSPRGFVAVPEGRAVVYPHISGRAVDLAGLPPGPGLAAELGRVLAAIHNLDRAVFDDAALPVYDAETWRTRRLADLDRGAATGHVPTSLLARWEEALEDVSMWRFAPAPVHGDITGDQVLVVFEDEDDSATGRVRGITGWDDAKVADPAEDFAAIVTHCDPRTVDTVLEAYDNHRVERADPHLRTRARLAAEMRVLSELLTAVSAGKRNTIRVTAASLRELDERTAHDDGLSSGGAPVETNRRWHRAATQSEEVAFDREQLAADDWTRSTSPAPTPPVPSVSTAVPAEDDTQVVEGPSSSQHDDVDEPREAVDSEATQPLAGGPFAEPTDSIPQSTSSATSPATSPATPPAVPVDEHGDETDDPQDAGPDVPPDETRGDATADAAGEAAEGEEAAGTPVESIGETDDDSVDARPHP